jgi:hypothetical protein
LTNDTKSNNGSISTTEETRNSSVPAKKAVPVPLSTPFVLLSKNTNIIWNGNRFEHQNMNKPLGVIQTKHRFLHRDFSSQRNTELKRMQSEKWTARPPLKTVFTFLCWVFMNCVSSGGGGFMTVLSLSIYYGIWSRRCTFLRLLWTEIADYLYYSRNKIEGS